MIIIDGRAIAKMIIGRLRQEPVFRKKLVVIIVGADQASLSFVGQKKLVAEELGVDFQLLRLPAETTDDCLLDELRQLSHLDEVGGIIIQLPLPSQINRDKVLTVLDFKKDVDALTERAVVAAPAVSVVEEILRVGGYQLSGKKVAVVGQGFLVGKPITKWLFQQAGVLSDLEIITADSATTDLIDLLSNVDLVITGVGKKGLIKPQFLKKGAAVIDFGYPPDLEQDFPERLQHLSFYTPTPGGTGPILVAKIFENFFILIQSTFGRIL